MGGGYPENKEIHRRLFQIFEDRSESDIDNEKLKKGDYGAASVGCRQSLFFIGGGLFGSTRFQKNEQLVISPY